MTARKHTHRGGLNSSDANDTDVQQIINILRQRSGSAIVDYLREITGFPELQLYAHLKVRKTGKIDIQTHFSSIRTTLEEENKSEGPIVTDGSGLVEDLDLSVTASNVFEILSSPRRREMIKQMARLTPTKQIDDTYVELGELATLTATNQLGVRASDLNQRERHRAYVSICQVHAEVLDEYGVADYYRRVKKISSSTDILALAEIVEVVEAVSSEDD